jgi:hypothetical protein
LAICLGGALASLAGLLLPLIDAQVSGVVILTSLLQGISQALSIGDATLEGFRDLFARLPLGVSLFVWIALTSSLCFWSLIWFAFIWRLPQIRRSQNEV